MANPKSMTVFEPGDRVGLIGDTEEIAAARRLLSPSNQDSHAAEQEDGIPEQTSAE